MDNGSLIETTLKIYNGSNVYQLYKQELNKAQLPKQIEWPVKLYSNIYKESNTISFLQSKWEMELWKLRDDQVHITLKYIKLEAQTENELATMPDTIVVKICLI